MIDPTVFQTIMNASMFIALMAYGVPFAQALFELLTQ